MIPETDFVAPCELLGLAIIKIMEADPVEWSGYFPAGTGTTHLSISHTTLGLAPGG